MQSQENIVYNSKSVITCSFVLKWNCKKSKNLLSFAFQILWIETKYYYNNTFRIKIYLDRIQDLKTKILSFVIIMGFSWRTHLLQFTCNKNLTNLLWKTWTCELGLSWNFPMTYKRNYIRLNYKIFYANICFLNESVTLMMDPAKLYVYQKVNHTKHRTILFNTGFYISLIYGILCTFEYLF